MKVSALQEHGTELFLLIINSNFTNEKCRHTSFIFTRNCAYLLNSGIEPFDIYIYIYITNSMGAS
jgi:hypothetical protein